MAEFGLDGKYGNDTFIINDVSFNVAPTQIRINKQTHNFRYDVLRSKTPHHIRSGHGQAQITVEIELVGINDIRTMQRLVAEVELTPFVYLENEHIRINMIGTTKDVSNMAACVKSLVISTNEGDREHLSATIVMDWFNYKPYSSSFLFASMSTDKPLNSPAESELWQIWINGAIKDKDYSPYPKARPINDMLLSGIDYLIQPTSGQKKKQTDRQKEKTYYENEFGGLSEQKAKHKLSKQEQQALDKAIEEINQRETALLYATDNPDAVRAAASNIRDVVRKTAKGEIRDFNEVVKAMKSGGWYLAGGEELETLQRLRAEATISDNYSIFWRPDILAFNPPEYFITNITYNLRNHYVHLPIIGHQYSTIQHLGGLDKQITISMIVDGEGALERLQSFWDRIQKSTLKMRTLTRSLAISVENDIINAFGVDLMIPEVMNHSTMKGNPGQYEVTMIFSPGVTEKEDKLEQAIPVETEKSLYKEFLGRIDKYFTQQTNLLWVIKPQYKAFLDNKNKASTEEAIIVRIIHEKLLPTLNENTLLRLAGDMAEPSALNTLRPLALAVTKGFNQLGDLAQSIGGLALPGAVVNRGIAQKTKYFADAARPTLNIFETVNLILKYETELNKNTIVGPYITRAAKFIKQYNEKASKDNAGTEQDSGKKNERQFTEAQQTALEKHFNSIIADIDAEMFLAVKEVLMKTLSGFESFKDLAEKAKKIGLLHGATCYPDLGLHHVEKALDLKKGEYLNPDFYFYQEGLAGWDQTAFYSMLGKAKEVVEEQERFMRESGGLIDWVQKAYLENLTREQAAVFQDKVSSRTLNTKQRFIRGDSKEGKQLADQITNISGNMDGARITNATKSAQERGRAGVTKDYKRNWSSSLNPDRKEVFSCANQIIHEYSADFINNGIASPPGQSRAIPRVKFSHPMGTLGHKTSDFGEERINKRGNKYLHAGVDWGSIQHDADGYAYGPIYAIADGIVAAITPSYLPRSVAITILHPEIGLTTFYQHIDSLAVEVIEGQKVKKGQLLGKIYPRTDKHSYSKNKQKPQGHLHFECWIQNTARLEQALGENIPRAQMLPGSSKKVNPEFVLNKATRRRSKNDQGFQLGKGLLVESLKSLEKSILQNNVYRLGRAFPTFKLYFIEEDTIAGDGRRALQFDDLFGYSALYDITVHRSENNAIDTAVITMSNVSGNLSNRRFGHDINNAYDKEGNKVKENQKKFGKEENPIASFMMQEGLKVQLKLGYEANPNNLEEVINGTVSGVEFNETTDVVSITIDSYGYELVQKIKGVVKPEEKTSSYLIKDAAETQEILSDLIAEDEVKHFGRWEPKRANVTRAALTDRWKLWPEPSDDNIFAPDSTSLDGGGGIIFEHLRYFIHRTTIWDVFKEMEYRHPECIAQAVPYAARTGPRMTMFFGAPSQMYFSKDLRIDQESEIRIAGPGQQQTNREKERESINAQREIARKHKSKFYFVRAIEAKKEVEKIRKTNMGDFLLEKGIQAGQIKPFRNYHLATSWTNIVSNSIKATGDNVYNTAIIHYDEVDGWSQETQQWEFESHFWDSGTVEMKAHYSIPEEYIKELRLSGETILNCETEDLAQRYALKALKEGLRNIYKGELVILGNPSIKPNDIIYIIDAYSDMIGPIEVSSVTHHLSKETGFVSIIKPKMCVAINEWSSMSITDALGYILQHITGIGLADPKAPRHQGEGTFSAVAPYVKSAADVGMAATGLSLVSIGAPLTAFVLAAGYGLFTLGGKKIIMMSQYGNPIILSPLVVHGKPLTAGIGHRYTNNGFWIHQINQGIRWAQDAEEGLRDAYGDFIDVLSDWWADDELGEKGRIFGRNK